MKRRERLRTLFMAAPHLNSNYFKTQIHDVETQAITAIHRVMDAYLQNRKGDVEGADTNMEEALQDLRILVDLLHTYGKKNGYQEVEELLEMLGLNAAELCPPKHKHEFEDDEDTHHD